MQDLIKVFIMYITYFGPADITGQLSTVQKSVIVPYNILIWLKKSTAETDRKNIGQKSTLNIIKKIQSSNNNHTT